MSRLRANQITNENANGAPNFPHGLTVTGVVTATTSATTMSQIVVGSAVTANSQGIDVTGIVTATQFKGDGSVLTGIDASSLKSGGAVKVQANTHGAVTTGVHTATSFSGSGAGLTGNGAGQIVKISFYEDTASGSAGGVTPDANDQWKLVGPQVTYTAAATANKLFFIHNHILASEDNNTWRMGLWRDGLSGTLVWVNTSYQQHTVWDTVHGITSVHTSAPDLNSHTYQFAIFARNQYGRLVYAYEPQSGYPSSGGQITLFEIKPPS